MTNIQKFQDRFENERVFILGNGPSLDDTPLDRLNGEYCIALNGINDIYPETSWRPSFYILLLDELEKNYDDYLKENLELGIECITLSQHKSKFGRQKNLYYINKKNLKFELVNDNRSFHHLSINDVKTMELQDLYDFWPDDISECVYTYHSMYAVIQLAMYMGFERIHLLGCDLGYGSYDPHMIFEKGQNPQGWDKGKIRFLLDSYQNGMLTKSIINGIVFKFLTSPIVDITSNLLDYISIFDDSNRFSSHSQFQPEDLTHVNDEITKSHIAAHRIASDQGIDIYNATIGGELDVYPRVSLKNIADSA